MENVKGYINPNEPINGLISNGNTRTDVHGLTKREYFAATAMQGVIFTRWLSLLGW